MSGKSPRGLTRTETHAVLVPRLSAAIVLWRRLCSLFAAMIAAGRPWARQVPLALVHPAVGRPADHCGKRIKKLFLRQSDANCDTPCRVGPRRVGKARAMGDPATAPTFPTCRFSKIRTTCHIICRHVPGSRFPSRIVATCDRCGAYGSCINSFERLLQSLARESQLTYATARR
jgi:hypothetical protein